MVHCPSSRQQAMSDMTVLERSNASLIRPILIINIPIIIVKIVTWKIRLLYLIYCALPPHKCVMECSGTPCIHGGSVQSSTELKLIYRQATVVAHRRGTLLGYRYGDRQNIRGCVRSDADEIRNSSSCSRSARKI